MSNLLKGYYTNLNTQNVRVIDSNARIVEKISVSVPTKIQPKEPDEDGFSEGLSADILSALTDEEDTNEAVAKEEAPTVDEEEYKMLLEEAQAQIEQMKEDARGQIEAMKKEALKDAEEVGYEEGFRKAESEFKAKELKLKQKEDQIRREYEKKVEEIEPMLVDVLTGIYEHVFRVELGEQKEIITYLITSTLKKVEGGRDCIVHVSKEDYPYVSMQKKQIVSGVSSNTTVEIVEDITLAKNCALIETEGGIFDCGLGTQLSELNRMIRLLSYEKDS